MLISIQKLNFSAYKIIKTRKNVGLFFFWAAFSVFHSRFFIPLRFIKRAPFKPGRVQFA